MVAHTTVDGRRIEMSIADLERAQHRVPSTPPGDRRYGKGDPETPCDLVRVDQRIGRERCQAVDHPLDKQVGQVLDLERRHEPASRVRTAFARVAEDSNRTTPEGDRAGGPQDTITSRPTSSAYGAVLCEVQRCS